MYLELAADLYGWSMQCILRRIDRLDQSWVATVKIVIYEDLRIVYKYRYCFTDFVQTLLDWFLVFCSFLCFPYAPYLHMLALPIPLS
jgi:hypothetical protein